MIDIHKLKSGDHILITDEYGNQQVEIVQKVDNEGITTVGIAQKEPIGESIEDIQLLNNLTTGLRRYYYYHKGGRGICDQ